ncbi:MAG: outer membrane protein assembly factor BamE [Zoogloeaceae bacterium]|nr:outer membrane protein assembly factor BamE [Zoogloeaceae bacterium]MCW5616933.1 outer membrane protein assembly factor BamE [Rhodocyclaceae bacterium]
MKTRFRNSSRALLASACGLLLSTGAVAASGYNITPEQIGLIKAGMNQGEVLKAVGEPVDTRSYGNQPGPTWVYRLLAQGDRTVDVDFDSSGRVVSSSIRLDYTGDTSYDR